MLQESVNATDLECLDSPSNLKMNSTPACGADTIVKILATSNACNAN